MQFSKKISSLVALFVLTTTFNSHKTYTMAPEQSKNLSWVALAGGVILGGVIAYKKFLSHIHEQTTEFSNLPLEIQYLIIDLLAKDSTATSLEEAAQTINSLAQVNHDLNNLINNSHFCLRIIKHLAKQFDCSDTTAAKTLKTKEAKERLKLQKLLDICHHVSTKDQANAQVKELIKAGIDISFSVKLNTDAIGKEIYGPPLFTFCTNPHVLNALIANGANINERSSDGSSILLYFIKKWMPSIKHIPHLLLTSVDPELADNDGLTPLQAAHNTGNQILVDLIQKAIEKKHEKK
jgi:hypothetical protein